MKFSTTLIFFTSLIVSTTMYGANVDTRPLTPVTLWNNMNRIFSEMSAHRTGIAYEHFEQPQHFELNGHIYEKLFCLGGPGLDDERERITLFLTQNNCFYKNWFYERMKKIELTQRDGAMTRHVNSAQELIIKTTDYFFPCNSKSTIIPINDSARRLLLRAGLITAAAATFSFLHKAIIHQLAIYLTS